MGALNSLNVESLSGDIYMLMLRGPRSVLVDVPLAAWLAAGDLWILIS